MKKEIIVDGIKYVPESENNREKAKDLKGMPYVIIRTYSAGVFAGYLESQKLQEVVMRQARRIWYWAGAASLSQLAIEGTSKPNECKFPVAVEKIKLLDAIEIIDCTQKSQDSIKSVKNWEQ